MPRHTINSEVIVYSALLTSLDGFLLPALALGYAELLAGSKELDLILNSLVSSISGIVPTTGSNFASTIRDEGLKKLTLLNLLEGVDNTFWSRVKEFRIVMLLKTVLNWPAAVKGLEGSWVVSSEVLRLMRSLLSSIKHIDGDFWEKGLTAMKEALEVISIFKVLIVQACVEKPMQFLPLQFSALKLLVQLTMLNDGPTTLEDDLWPKEKYGLFSSVLSLITVAAGTLFWES